MLTTLPWAAFFQPLLTFRQDLTFTHWRMDFFKCQLTWLKANRPDLPFVLSEGALHYLF